MAANPISAWWKKNQGKVTTVHCCFKSKIVAMGVAVAAIVFSNLEVHRTKQDLMRARDIEVAKARRTLAPEVQMQPSR